MSALPKLLIVGLLAVLILMVAIPATAQDGPDAWPTYNLYMRSGPDSTYAEVTLLAPQTGLILEARNADTSWVLGHTADRVWRGWIAALYLSYRDGFSPAILPLSSEVVSLTAPVPTAVFAGSVSVGSGENNIVMTAYNNVNVRRGPGTSYGVVGHLQPGMSFVAEGVSANGAWILGHLPDDTLRGWVSGQYLRFESGSAAALPVSSEILNAPAAAIATAPAAPSPRGSYTLPDVSGIDLNAYPVVPGVTGAVSSIYARGRARGMNAHVVAKVGDCGSDSPDFLGPFGWNSYSLGNYGYLQGVIDHFGASLTYVSQAAGAGFVADAVIDPRWANPAVCQPNKSALQCEYRIHQPAVAIIMFGITDLQRRTPDQFYSDLRAVVDQSIAAGVIPVLSTFPRHLAFPEESILFNQIVVRVALDYDLPLINFWRAMEPLPNHGMMEDGTHMTMYTVGGAGHLVDANLTSGFTLRNLVTLQALDAIWQGVLR